MAGPKFTTDPQLINMPSSSGQSLEDKLYAVKYFISGQGLSLVVLKATTSELMGPKKKHLKYLVNMTHEPNVSIPSLTRLLMRRAKHHQWSVAFKSLITIHHLMSYANERFIQNLSSSKVNNKTLIDIASFNDRSSYLAYDMSTFVRRYARYLDSKLTTYRTLGIDFCRITPNDRALRTNLKEMEYNQLMILLPSLESQFDSLIEFDAYPKDLNNGIVNFAFYSLYKDFVRLYIAYQTSIIRILELYFKTQDPKRVRDMYEIYKKFLIRMDKVTDFMRTIDSVGIDQSDMPNVSRLPNLSITSLNDHLKQVELGSQSRSRLALDSIAAVGPKSREGKKTLIRSQSTASSPYSFVRYDYCYPALEESVGKQPEAGEPSIPKLKMADFGNQRRRSKRRPVGSGDQTPVAPAPMRPPDSKNDCDTRESIETNPNVTLDDKMAPKREETSELEKLDEEPSIDLMVLDDDKTDCVALNNWVKVDL